MNKLERWKYLMAPFLALLMVLGVYGSVFANSFAATKNEALNTPTLLIGGMGVQVGDLWITEQLPGTLTAGAGSITITLPPHVTFSANVGPTNVADPASGFAAAADVVTQAIAIGDSVLKLDVVTSNVAVAKGIIKIPGLTFPVNIATAAAPGPLGVTIGGWNAGITAGTVTSAHMVKAGTATTVIGKPMVLIGTMNQTAATITITENVDLSLGDGVDSVRLALPAGVKFSFMPGGVGAGGVAVVPTAGQIFPSNILRIDVAQGPPDAIPGSITIGPIWYNVDPTVLPGDVVVNVGGTNPGITAETVVNAEAAVVGTSLNIIDIPPTGTNPLYRGRNNQLPDNLRLDESAPGTLLGSGRTIVLTLGTGAQFTGPPPLPQTVVATPTQGSGINLGWGPNVPVTVWPLPNTNSATWGVASSGMFVAEKINFTFNAIPATDGIQILANAPLGDLMISVGGSAGATPEDTVIGEIKDATTHSVIGDVPALTIGLQGQSIADVQIVEDKAGLLVPPGDILLVLPAGATFDAVPTSVTVTDGDIVLGPASLVGFNEPNDAIRIPVTTPSAIKAGTIEVKGMLVTLDNTVPVGTLKIAFRGWGGVIPGPTSLTVGNVTTGFFALVVAPSSHTIAEGGTATSTVTGGTAPYGVASSDEGVAIAAISAGTVTITGVAEGSCTITVSDSTSSVQTAPIAVTVTAAVPIDPPTTQYVGSCDAACQATAPMTVAGGVMDVNFDYTAPVEVIAGVMSEDFVTVWWLTDSCDLSTDYAQAATNSMLFFCPDVPMPAGSEQGWVFWLVAPTASADMGDDGWWNTGVYELMWYQLP